MRCVGWDGMAWDVGGGEERRRKARSQKKWTGPMWWDERRK